MYFKHYSCYRGPFERVASLCKAEYLHITVVIVGPFKSSVAYLHIAVALGGSFASGVLNYDVVRKILYEQIIIFSPKMRNICVRNTLRGSPETGDSRRVLRCLPLNTPLYITFTMILCENMKPTEHVLLLICVLSQLMCAYKHRNIKLVEGNCIF